MQHGEGSRELGGELVTSGDSLHKCAVTKGMYACMHVRMYISFLQPPRYNKFKLFCKDHIIQPTKTEVLPGLERHAP